eukprot:6204759-Pleurochrysis_carterae.AAC.1
MWSAPAGEGERGRAGEGDAAQVPAATAAGGTGASRCEDHEAMGTQDGAGGARVLVVFAGTGVADSTLARSLRELGAGATEIDIAAGGRDHDVLRSEVADTLLAWVRRGDFTAVFAAPPCSSFSVAHTPRLRSRDRPEGVQPMPRRWA